MKVLSKKENRLLYNELNSRIKELTLFKMARILQEQHKKDGLMPFSFDVYLKQAEQLYEELN